MREEHSLKQLNSRFCFACNAAVDALVEELGYPNQVFILHPAEKQRAWRL